MKNKKLILSILWLIFFGFLVYKGHSNKKYNTVENIRLKMEKHLKEKYNEDFIILLSHVYSKNFLEGIIIPKRYEGTKKMIDPFYKTDIGIEINKIPILGITTYGEIYDGYPDILIKEELERDTKKILEKNFGKNVLIALQLEGPCRYSTVKEEIEFRKIQKITDPLSGGIYIFGRVESEKDREKYRRGIYEFIQYLKQEGMFEYVDMTIFITDERFLSKEFDKLGIHEKLLENYREYRKTRKSNQKRTPEEVYEFVKKKQKIYSEIGENYTLDTSKIDKISRDEVIDLNENLMCGIVAVVRIVSEKAIKTNYFLRDEKIKKYDKLEDVELE